MTPMKKYLLFTILILHSLTAFAIAQQDHAVLITTVATFVKTQTSAMPGKVKFDVNEIDHRIVLQSCKKIEAYLPTGSQLIGRTSIGVRCNEPNGWHIFIPVQITISRDLIVSAKPLTLGQVVHKEDIARLTTDATQNIGMTDDSQVIGKVLRYSIASGYILRQDMLREPFSVKQGQVVRLLVQGSGFSLSSSGVALNNAAEGNTVQIRTTSGRVISGIAGEEGAVRITP